jgi:vancomycin aglycone glucosyltransferase
MSKPGAPRELPIQSSHDEDKKKRILISTIGSRGEVQPILGLALELQALGHRAVLCVPPNFQGWVESCGVECVPIGPDVQKLSVPRAGVKRRKPSWSTMRQLVRTSVIEQFLVMGNAAAGCDLIVVAGDLQHAGRSVAEMRKLPYIHATYCPVTLKSPDYPPPTLGSVNRSQTLPRWVNRLLWKASEWHWNALYRAVLNEQREAIGLGPVKDAPSHIATKQPWLAVDPVLARVAPTKNMRAYRRALGSSRTIGRCRIRSSNFCWKANLLSTLGSAACGLAQAPVARW